MPSDISVLRTIQFSNILFQVELRRLDNFGYAVSPLHARLFCNVHRDKTDSLCLLQRRSAVLGVAKVPGNLSGSVNRDQGRDDCEGAFDLREEVAPTSIGDAVSDSGAPPFCECFVGLRPCLIKTEIEYLRAILT